MTRKNDVGLGDTYELEHPFYAHVVSPYSNLTRLNVRNDLQSKERLFVVGDVHGCVNELSELLTKLNYQPEKDQVILAGDLTAKGPDSRGVIRLAQEMGLLCVRGNHDDQVIRFKTYENVHGVQGAKTGEVVNEGNVMDPIKFGDEHDTIARNMTQEEYDFLVGCPLIMELPFMNARVVHAGLDPNISDLPKNDPWTVLNIRNVRKGVPIAANHQGTHWTEFWTEAQNKTSPLIIYYGHDAARGLDLETDTFGLDSRCVYGGELSALELHTHQLTQIKCKAYTKTPFR
ncbi:hypothetical protein DFQ28_002147 [Apophysomyces sp. BC1034]|nr:hypothetical protein DFQ30_007614 [Apophysomyces sp. BC1015]KAG0179806.1 hypothetical protein DFQ29_001653 [Apophysomyces sp. BC1021]KAG0190368.1 hypothetical protein DFQ28_002147 [Apophysomyces sp. BC1034]